MVCCVLKIKRKKVLKKSAIAKIATLKLRELLTVMTILNRKLSYYYSEVIVTNEPTYATTAVTVTHFIREQGKLLHGTLNKNSK